ncbi:fibronectin type III domain protein, partial [Ancylostoma ceylanicum]
LWRCCRSHDVSNERESHHTSPATPFLDYCPTPSTLSEWWRSLTMNRSRSAAATSKCPADPAVALEAAEPTTLRFTWTKPNCDESVAPIDGYEYLASARIHETDQAAPHSGASYIGGTAVAVPDLRPSTKYSFRVRSRNANGHSPWSESIHVATEAEGAAIVDKSNLYKVRVVLSPPEVYLVWTPLPEHTNRIAYFKYVAFRRRVRNRAATASSRSRRTNGTVQRCRIAYKERASTRWLRVVGRPQDFACPAGVADSNDFCYQLQHLFFGVHYISRSRATLRPFISAGVEQAPRFQINIDQPRIEQRGSQNVAYWSTSGDTSQLFGYQVDIRRDGDREWHEQGPLVRSEPSQSHFRQSLGAVPVATYYLRVRAVDSNMATVATSPSTSFSVSCQPPISPENVRLDRVSDDFVRISWTFPTEDPACQTYFFITGVQNGVPVNHRVPGTERSYDINGPARGDWRVEVLSVVRAVNSAGSGPASRQAVFTSAQQCEYQRQSEHQSNSTVYIFVESRSPYALGCIVCVVSLLIPQTQRDGQQFIDPFYLGCKALGATTLNGAMRGCLPLSY